MTTVGDTLPAFELQDQHGGTVRDTNLRGHWIVLYCYPKDMTPGCSQEAMGFQDQQDEFLRLGFRIFGISADSVVSHTRFATKDSLTFTLLSDPQHVLLEELGVWKGKRLAGHDFMGTERTTFMIDPEGKIVREWRKVRVKRHIAAVLEAAREVRA
ncbi:MAG: peroxiredoxin [Caldiserica bacterium]|nr:peroxiredoxin [Caldisericota bacterium]